MIQFLTYLGDFLQSIFTFDFISGLSIYTILFYNMILVSFWYAFVRRRS